MTTLVRAAATVPAWMLYGLWVATCPVCGATGDVPVRAAVAQCQKCGAWEEIDWPAEQMMQGVVRLLMMRPDPATQNWAPGESLHALIFENAAHGLFDMVTGDPFRSVLTVGDDRIILDELPKAPGLLELTGGRLAVGA